MSRRDELNLNVFNLVAADSALPDGRSARPMRSRTGRTRRGVLPAEQLYGDERDQQLENVIKPLIDPGRDASGCGPV